MCSDSHTAARTGVDPLLGMEHCNVASSNDGVIVYNVFSNAHCSISAVSCIASRAQKENTVFDITFLSVYYHAIDVVLSFVDSLDTEIMSIVDFAV